MSENIIQLLKAERDRFDRAIEALQGSSPRVLDIYDNPTMPDWVKPALKKAVTPAAPKRKGMSAATRRRMAEGQKRRYAALRAAKVAEAAPLATTPKAAPVKTSVAVKKGNFTEAGRKALSIAMKKRWEAKRAAVVAESVSPKRKTNSVRIAEAVAPPEDAEFKKKMSEAMKASWAKRKKVAKK